MEDAKYLDLVAKYLSGNIDREEREALLQWVDADEANRRFFDEMIQLWSMSAEVEEPFEADVEDAWERLENKLPATSDEEETKVVPLRKRRWDWRIAAALLLLISGSWLVFKTMAGQPEVISAEVLNGAPLTLPDGSKVWLNEDSRLVFSKRFKHRIVRLEGEAFFEVARDETRPFSVQTDQALTTVLGTSFNLRAYPKEDRIELVVKTGKVKFESLNKKENKSQAILEKNQAAVFIKEKQEVVPDSTFSDNTTAWMRDTLVFNNDQMRKVISDLQRYFRVDIRVEDEGAYNCSFNSTFPQPRLEYVFEEMEEALEGISVTQQGDTYILRGRCSPK